MAFFNKLRSLASHVDSSVVQLQQDIVEENVFNNDVKNHSSAINQMHHNLKDSREMHHKVESLTDDFVRRNQSFNHAFDLFSKVIESHKSRLENVEDHMEKYGFKKLSLNQASETSGSENETEEQSDQTEDTDREASDETTRTQSKTDVMTDIPKSSPDPPRWDFGPKLSKDTLMLLEQVGMKEKQTTATEESEPVSRTPNLETGGFVKPVLPSRSNRFFDTPDDFKPGFSGLPEPPKLLSQSLFNSETKHEMCEYEFEPENSHPSDLPLPPKLTSVYNTGIDKSLDSGETKVKEDKFSDGIETLSKPKLLSTTMKELSTNILPPESPKNDFSYSPTLPQPPKLQSKWD